MQKQIKSKEILSYGLGDFACGMIYNFVFTYVFYYYSDVIKLSLGAVSFIMVAGRGFATVIDFFVGMLVDRTRTRFGSTRPYILWFFLPLGISSILLFTTVQGSMGMKVAYAVVTYMIQGAIYALLNDPYTLLMSMITDDENERLKLNISKTILSGVGGITVMAITLKGAELIDKVLGNHVILGYIEVSGFTMMAAVYALIGMVFLCVCFVHTKERTAGSKDTLSLRDAFKAAWKNRFWKTGIVIGCLVNLAVTIKMTSTLYYAQYVMQNKDFSNILLILHMGTSVVAVMCLPLFIKKAGRKGTFLTGGAAMIIGSLLQWAGSTSITIFIVGSVIASFSLNMLNSLSVFVMFDTIDYTQKTSRVRPHGFMFSVYCVISKMSTAFAAAILSAAMGKSGYVAGMIQSQATQYCIGFFYILLPALFVSGILIAAKFFTIEQEIRLQLEKIA